MRYTQEEFCQIITSAKCCAADLGYSYVIHKRNGEDDKAECEADRLELLIHYIETTANLVPQFKPGNPGTPGVPGVPAVPGTFTWDYSNMVFGGGVSYTLNRTYTGSTPYQEIGSAMSALDFQTNHILVPMFEAGLSGPPFSPNPIDLSAVTNASVLFSFAGGADANGENMVLSINAKHFLVQRLVPDPPSFLPQTNPQRIFSNGATTYGQSGAVYQDVLTGSTLVAGGDTESVLVYDQTFTYITSWSLIGNVQCVRFNVAKFFLTFTGEPYIICSSQGIYDYDASTQVITPLHTDPGFDFVFGDMCDDWGSSAYVLGNGDDTGTNRAYIYGIDGNGVVTIGLASATELGAKCLTYDFLSGQLILGVMNDGNNKPFHAYDPVTLAFIAKEESMCAGFPNARYLSFDLMGNRFAMGDDGNYSGAPNGIVIIERYSEVNVALTPVAFTSLPGKPDIYSMNVNKGSQIDWILFQTGFGPPVPYQGELHILGRTEFLTGVFAIVQLDAVTLIEPVNPVYPSVEINTFYGVADDWWAAQTLLSENDYWWYYFGTDGINPTLMAVNHTHAVYNYNLTISGGVDAIPPIPPGPPGPDVPILEIDCLTLDEKNGVIEKVLDICACKSCQGNSDKIAPIVDDSLDLGDQGVLII